MAARWRYGGGGSGFEMYYLAVGDDHTAAILSRSHAKALWRVAAFWKRNNAGEATFAGVLGTDDAKQLSVAFVGMVRAASRKAAKR